MPYKLATSTYNEYFARNRTFSFLYTVLYTVLVKEIGQNMPHKIGAYNLVPLQALFVPQRRLAGRSQIEMCCVANYFIQIGDKEFQIVQFSDCFINYSSFYVTSVAISDLNQVVSTKPQLSTDYLVITFLNN